MDFGRSGICKRIDYDSDSDVSVEADVQTTSLKNLDDINDVDVGDYVLCAFTGKRQVDVHYVGIMRDVGVDGHDVDIDDFELEIH